jgi:hypothetical protein
MIDLIGSENPNIFKYATSELTQDAFLCWVLEGLNYPKCEINQFSKGFLKLLMKEANRQSHMVHNFSSDEVISVDVEKQKDHIDILITLHIKNGYGEFTRILIIEDKTFTGPHDDQLFRYKSKYAEDQPICIYYKMGFLFNDDEHARIYGYATINKLNMISLMQLHAAKVRSDIYLGYYHHILQLQDEEDELAKIITEFISKGIGQIAEALKRSEGQFMLMKMLIKADSIVKHIRNDGHPPLLYDKISRGFNRDGSPWTQYMILFHSESEAAKSGLINSEDIFYDEIFFRIDKKSKGYYISLRQYSKNELNNWKLEDRLPRLRKCFEDACKTVENDRKKRISLNSMTFINPKFEVPGNRGAYEREIALHYIKDGYELELMCELLGVINDQFIINIRKEFT